MTVTSIPRLRLTLVDQCSLFLGPRYAAYWLQIGRVWLDDWIVTFPRRGSSLHFLIGPRSAEAALESSSTAIEKHTVLNFDVPMPREPAWPASALHNGDDP